MQHGFIIFASTYAAVASFFVVVGCVWCIFSRWISRLRSRCSRFLFLENEMNTWEWWWHNFLGINHHSASANDTEYFAYLPLLKLFSRTKNKKTATEYHSAAQQGNVMCYKLWLLQFANVNSSERCSLVPIFVYINFFFLRKCKPKTIIKSQIISILFFQSCLFRCRCRHYIYIFFCKLTNWFDR